MFSWNTVIRWSEAWRPKKRIFTKWAQQSQKSPSTDNPEPVLNKWLCKYLSLCVASSFCFLSDLSASQFSTPAEAAITWGDHYFCCSLPLPVQGLYNHTTPLGLREVLPLLDTSEVCYSACLVHVMLTSLANSCHNTHLSALCLSGVDLPMAHCICSIFGWFLIASCLSWIWFVTQQHINRQTSHHQRAGGRLLYGH